MAAPGMIGGDPEGMRRLARLFEKHGRELEQIVRDLNSNTVNSESIWVGGAANNFRSAWAQAKPSFDRMVQAFHEANKDIASRATGFENVGGH